MSAIFAADTTLASDDLRPSGIWRYRLAWMLRPQLRWNARRLDSAQFDDGLSAVLDPAINTRSTRSAVLHSHQLSRSLLERMCSNVAPSARIAAAISQDSSIAERFCS